MILYLIRHPQTEWNVEKILQWHFDSPLTEFWRHTTFKIRDKLKNSWIEKIYSSDLWRCEETSKIINSVLGVPLVLTDMLRERDFWIYNWMKKEDVIDLFDYNNPEEIAPSWESDLMMSDRILENLPKILSWANASTLLIVTHHGPLKSVLNASKQPLTKDLITDVPQWYICKFSWIDNEFELLEIIS